jgi:hypothetical protein
MKYLKAYLTALALNLGALGALYLALSAVFHKDLASMYLVYVCLLGSIAGPLRVVFNNQNRATV